MGKNRTMEAKRIKYILQSKARPRHLKPDYGVINGRKPISNADRVPKEFEELFQYRKRGDTSPVIDEYLEALYPTHQQLSQVRIEALHKSLQPAKDMKFVTNLVDGKYTKLAMLATSKLDCIYFIEYQVIPGIIRYSYTYGSHSRAMEVARLQTIRWKEVIHIPNVE